MRSGSAGRPPGLPEVGRNLPPTGGNPSATLASRQAYSTHGRSGSEPKLPIDSPYRQMHGVVVARNGHPIHIHKGKKRITVVSFLGKASVGGDRIRLPTKARSHASGTILLTRGVGIDQLRPTTGTTDFVDRGPIAHEGKGTETVSFGRRLITLGRQPRRVRIGVFSAVSLHARRIQEWPGARVEPKPGVEYQLPNESPGWSGSSSTGGPGLSSGHPCSRQASLLLGSTYIV